MLNDLADAAASIGGSWVKLRTTDDPPVEGKVVAFEARPKTFEGAPVLNRKTGAQRTEWVFTLDTGGEDHVKVSLNESAQRAVADALRTAGVTAPKAGDTLKIGVKADPASDREQATYQAKWTVGAAPLDIPSSDDASDPF
jgi:hypothetical protein